MKYTVRDKAKALAAFLRVPINLVEVEPGDTEHFFVSDSEFFVLTDEEAEIRAMHIVANSLDVLPPEDMMKYCYRGCTIGDLKAFQEKNDINTIFNCMKDFAGYCGELFEERTRGYFLAEDRVEITDSPFFIYRLN